MTLNDTVSANRLHIGFFGMRNAGKSSVVNAVVGQDLSLVSEVKGTTTDPVSKAMELLPIGPVVIIDTPGLDDEGELGRMRVTKARKALSTVDVAVIVVDATVGFTSLDSELKKTVEDKKIPYVCVFNKADLLPEIPTAKNDEIYVSAKTGFGIFDLKEKIAASVPKGEEKRIVGDLISPEDIVVLVTPIDESAPKGRLILPQQQTIRDILDSGAIPVVCRDTELSAALKSLAKKPRLVITDSQVFGKVAKILPKDIPLTSFSILFARYKGTLNQALEGAWRLDLLKDGDTVLISEGCTHHRQCGDIGTVKLPKWISDYTGKKLNFKFTSGKDFPDELSGIALVIHCGGCMLTEREMHSRAAVAEELETAFSNYGIIIAHIHGILLRSLEPFPEVLELFGKR